MAGRRLVESADPVAGSMARSAAAILHGEGPSGIRLSPDLATVLCRAADDVAGAPLPASGPGPAPSWPSSSSWRSPGRTRAGDVRSDGFFT